MKFKKLIILIIFSLFFTSCTQQEKIDIIKADYEIEIEKILEVADNSQRLVNEYENEIKILESKINCFEKSEIDQEIKIQSLEDEIIKLNKTLIEMEQTENDDINLLMYKSLAKYYKKALLNEFETINPNYNVVTANDIRIGMNFIDVINYMGIDYTEEAFFNGYRGVAESVWQYDGIKIRFDPIFTNFITISSDSVSTNIGIAVGDSALDTLNYCKSTFQVANTPNGGKIFNWFDTGDGNYLILYFDKELTRTNQNIDITEDTKIELIEIARMDCFD